MDISNIIYLLGGVSLFLFGMQVMGLGLKQVAGSKLELILYKLSNTPFKGIVLGTAVTSVIQSSAATSVMVVGFVNSEMMKLKQAISVILGSFLGTSITGWIICLSQIEGSSGWASLVSTKTFTGIIAVVGIILYMFMKSPAQKHLGSILLGFAVLMFGIDAMSSAVSPLKNDPAFINLMVKFENPFLGFFVGVIVTAILQSASSAVGILQTLAITGAIDFSVAFPILLGMAVGASVPVLLSSIGATENARRSALSYLIISLISAIVVAVIFYVLNTFVQFSFMDRTMTAVSIAFVNSLYRFIAVILMLPFISQTESLLIKLIPNDPNNEKFSIQPLEERFLAHPAVAIEHCRNAVFSMADLVYANILEALECIRNYSPEVIKAINTREVSADKYEDRIGNYLMKISAEDITPSQAAEVSKYLHAIGDLERISDHAVNLAEASEEIHDKKILFSEAANHELDVVVSALKEILTLATDTFKSNNLDQAYHVEPLEELMDNLCDEMKLHHIERLQKGICTFENGFVFNDLATDFERISDHCSNLAVAVIELSSPDDFDPHSYLDSLKELRTGFFDHYYDEYAQKYHF